MTTNLKWLIVDPYKIPGSTLFFTHISDTYNGDIDCIIWQDEPYIIFKCDKPTLKMIMVDAPKYGMIVLNKTTLISMTNKEQFPIDVPTSQIALVRCAITPIDSVQAFIDEQTALTVYAQEHDVPWESDQDNDE